MAMVWIALLGGGDYAPEGLTGFGKLTTPESARADSQVPLSLMPWRTQEWRISCIATKLVGQ
jgi:hypothetical protein